MLEAKIKSTEAIATMIFVKNRSQIEQKSHSLKINMSTCNFQVLISIYCGITCTIEHLRQRKDFLCEMKERYSYLCCHIVSSQFDSCGINS
jgi:hypothetical protein